MKGKLTPKQEGLPVVLIVERTGQLSCLNDVSKTAFIQDIEGRGGCTEGERKKFIKKKQSCEKCYLPQQYRVTLVFCWDP